jgi:hypothetical protein
MGRLSLMQSGCVEVRRLWGRDVRSELMGGRSDVKVLLPAVLPPRRRLCMARKSGVEDLRCCEKEAVGDSARRKALWLSWIDCAVDDAASSRHLVFSSSRRAWSVPSKALRSCSSSARTSVVVFSAAAKRVCIFDSEACSSVFSASSVPACSLMLSSSSSSLLAFELASLVFLRISASRRAISSWSFSSVTMRAFKLLSIPCQFSVAREYCV